MSKKLLSVLLAIVMVISSVSCLFTMTTVTASAEGENLMQNISASDWVSGWNGSQGTELDGEISISAAWRSVYTKVTLAPETEYDLTFKFGQTRVGDVRVYPASEITDIETQLRSVGAAPTQGGTTNLASDSITCSITSGTPVDGEFYEASETFKTTAETEYYIILDCYQCADSRNSVLLKDMKITEVPFDPNVLKDTSAKDWKSSWGPRDATTTADGYITVGVAYRSAYTKVTLEPYTKYSFSFKHGEVKVNNIRVFAASEITDTTTQLVSGADGGAALGGTNNLVSSASTSECPATPVAGEFYNASAIFTTGAETEYYIIIDCGAFNTTSIILKDLSLIGEAYNIDEELVNPANWNSTWRLQGSTVNVTAATETKNGGAGIYVDKSNYRDTFATVVLEPNSEYTLSFNYKGSSVLQKVWVYDKADIDLEAYKATNAKYPDSISAALKSGASALGEIYTANAGTFDGETWLNVTFKFNTTENREYYIVLNHGANSGFTASDLTLEKKVVDPDNVLDNTVAANWGSSWSGRTATTNAAGYITVASAFRSVYTKVTLEPNTKYVANFVHGEVRVTDIRVFAASEITDTTTQLVSGADGGAAPGGTNNLATASVSTNCPATPVAGEFYTSSETFTTGSETEYYILLDCGAFSTTSIVLKDLSLKKHVPDANVDVVDPTNWNSTWNLSSPGTVAFTKSTDSCEGGEAINISKSNYRSSFVKLILTPNADYKLSFNYKGTSAVSNLHLIALNDIDEAKYAAKPEQLITALKSGASTVFTEGFSGLTYDGTTWNEISVEFATNENTEYYLVFENNTAGSGFVASDFSFEAEEKPMDIDDLTDTVATDWTSSWGGRVGTYEKVIAVKNAWRSAYTKIALEPYTNYNFTFKASTVKVSGVRVFAASEITDTTTQLVSPSGGGAVTGGTNDLVNAFSTTAPADDYATATPELVNKFYNVSASFATGADTEYYIIVDASQFLNNGGDNPNCTFTHMKNLSLIAGEKVEIDPNVLANVSSLPWNSTWNITAASTTATIKKSTDSCEGGEAIVVDKSNYRDTFVRINLNANTKYQLSFNYKGVSELNRIQLIAVNDIDSSKWGASTEHVMLALADGKTPVYEEIFSDFTFDGTTWNNISTVFTTNENTEYYLVLYHTAGSGFVASDFSLLEYVDPNKLVDATVANGDVRWSVGDDAEEDYITGAEGKEDELVTYTDGNGNEVTRSRVYYYDELNPAYNYNGGYAWRIIISSETAMNVYNPAVYGYITAKGLAANTKYTFSYIYTDTYHVKLADIYNAAGSIADIDVTTKMLPTKENSTNHSYMVTANFTTGDEGDYTIKLQTGRSSKYYIYDASSWAMTVSDLSLTEYEEVPGEDIPDDANLLENPEELDWKATWSTITHSTNGYNGTKAVSLGGIQYHALYTRLDTLAPNSEYTLTFKYKSNAAIDVVGITDAANVNLANVNDKFSSTIVEGGNIVYYADVPKVIDGATWNDATVKFVTGDATTYYLYFEGNSAANPEATGGITISDMNLSKVTGAFEANKVEYDFENGSIGAISTTSGADIPSVVEENGNKYLKFTRTNDGITVPFWYNGENKYVVSFDMKVLSYPDEILEMHFRTCADDNNMQYSEGNIFTYRNDAYNVVTKDLNGKLLTFDTGLNYNENPQFEGSKHVFDSSLGTDWRRYEITIDPEYTYYTGLANFGFNSNSAGWSIALDNIKVTAIDNDFENTAIDKFSSTKLAAIRQRTIDSKQGIRVKSTIDTSLLTAGDDGFKIVEYGTLAINSAKLAGAELTYDMLNSDYNAKVGVAYSAADGKNEVFSNENGVVTFTGVLTGLKDYTTEYSVRGYMIAESADGEQFVLYENSTKSLSVYDVVYAILSDGVENDDDIVANQIVSANETKYNNWVEENAAEEEQEITGSKTFNLTVSNSAAPIIDDYRGFSGTVYHAFGFMEDDVTGRVYDADMIDTELDRLEDAGVHYLRTRYDSHWIFDDATGYDWNSDRFNYFCNYANALQERDMEVILQVGWHFDFISREENATYSIHENDYFNGEGDDRYGESAGVDFTGKTDDEIRIMKAANRYAYMMANTLKYAKAKGINNIKYFSYFVEPSNTYSVSEDGTLLDQYNLKAGHDKVQYVLFCRTMRDALEDKYNVTGIKHMGPNEASYSKLTEYVVENDPTLFDVITAHHYPEEGDVATNYDTYYNTMTNNTHNHLLNGYSTDFNDYKSFLATVQQSNASAEFWCDEFNIKDFDPYEGRGTSSFYRGLATAMGGIVAQQCGIQNTILWMSFDQLWTDHTGGTAGSESEFMNGIHQCGNAPSLFLSDQPYAQYYPTTLFSKYNGYQNGKVYGTNLSSTEQQGVYVGAVQLEDGSWTVSVLNMNTTAVNINVAFDTAINQTLYRHIVSADKADSYADAKIPDADKSFTNVGTSFSDVLPAGSFAVYTGVR
ncbi:MAG: hypothetical protein IJC36_01855 [Clostridia bacterium]|nr:hypothetical protein [Clostridia bacterium]